MGVGLISCFGVYQIRSCNNVAGRIRDLNVIDFPCPIVPIDGTPCGVNELLAHKNVQ